MAERPEDLNLPNSVIARIIKESLPDGVNVAKDARLAMAKAASVFVLYATSCANNFAMQHKRKTIAGQDVLEAMKEMEFEKFVEPLKASLEEYKKEQKGKKDASEKKKKEKDQNSSKDEDAENGDGDEEVEEVVEADDDAEDEVEEGDDIIEEIEDEEEEEEEES